MTEMSEQMGTDPLFKLYGCVDCGKHVYHCTACAERMFIRRGHYCDDDKRERLLQKLFPYDEGVVEACQHFYYTCSCTRLCRHSLLELIKTV